MNTMHSLFLRKTAYCSLFAALTAAGAYISIPVGPVPIVLQNLFVFLAGILLGRKMGFTSVGAYILVGALGFPVFAGGRGGIGAFLGPTGGYLLGYLPGVYIIGLISEKKQNKVYDIIAMCCGSSIVYFCGVSWLKLLTNMSLSKTLIVGMYPFIPGDVLKIAAAVPVAKALRPLLQNSLHGGENY
jgi:biotin transport system substrate-specific component